MGVSISVVIPAHNSAPHLKRCLESLLGCRNPPLEVVVVDDGSKDCTLEMAATFPVMLLSTGKRRGPALARNLGAKASSGDVLLFLDSDVCVPCDALDRIRESFEADPNLDALIGSYDNMPDCQDFLSQYRNLMHAFVHQTGAQRASTFWSGCGAIRSDVFRQHSGFNEDFGRPAIEDIELGYRLIRAGRKVMLDRAIQVTHLKRWTFWGLVRTDILDRGIPWTELILRDRFMPDDLNLQLSQRVSVALVFLLLAMSGFMAVLWGAYFLVPLFAIVFLLLARWWVEFPIGGRPRGASIGLVSLVALIAALAYSHDMMGIVPPVIVSPVLLLAGHRYSKRGKKRKLLRWLAVAYIVCSVLAAARYLPAHLLVFSCFALLAILGLMNSQFYLFLAGKRGIPFMLAAIPFHLLYHFYNGISFIVGTLRYSFRLRRANLPRRNDKEAVLSARQSTSLE